MTHDEDTLPQVVGCTLAVEQDSMEEKDGEISRLKQECADLRLTLQHQEQRIGGLLTEDTALISFIKSLERPPLRFWPFCFRRRIVSQLEKIVLDRVRHNP